MIAIPDIPGSSSAHSETDRTHRPTLEIAKDILLSEKRVGDSHASNLLPILKVFTVKNATLTFDRRSDN
jgi:hypothetical protein